MEGIVQHLATIIFAILIILTIGFSLVLFRDFMAHKNELEKETKWPHTLIIGFVVNFFDTLGIGSFAPTTALLKFTRQVRDKIIPGTLNASCAIPVLAEALIFIDKVEVEPVTLFSMLFAAGAGAYFGAGIIAKFSEQRIRLIMGCALFCTAFLMLCGMMQWMPIGGDAIGLSGYKLFIGIAANFILGALMTAGIGLYAPCMALVYFLGMSPIVAFPLMMGASAVLMPIAAYRFIKEKAYNRKASVAITLGGVAGVFIAAYIVTSMPLNTLRWLVIGVIIYTSITMLHSYMKGRAEIAGLESSVT